MESAAAFAAGPIVAKVRHDNSEEGGKRGLFPGLTSKGSEIL